MKKSRKIEVVEQVNEPNMEQVMKEIAPFTSKVVDKPQVQNIDQSQKLTINQICNIKKMSDNIRGFLHKKYKNQLNTESEWNLIFEKERLI